MPDTKAADQQVERVRQLFLESPDSATAANKQEYRRWQDGQRKCRQRRGGKWRRGEQPQENEGRQPGTGKQGEQPGDGNGEPRLNK